MERKEALSLLGLSHEASLRTAEKAYQFKWDECNRTIDQANTVEEQMASLREMEQLDRALSSLKSAANQTSVEIFDEESSETIIIPASLPQASATPRGKPALVENSGLDLELNETIIVSSSSDHTPLDDEELNPTIMVDGSEIGAKLRSAAQAKSAGYAPHGADAVDLDLDIDKTIIGDPTQITGSPAAAASDRNVFEIGQTLLQGRYTIEAFIDKGGMGEVYRAHDQMRRETVAIKVLLPQLDAAAYERFFDEARLSSCLSHQSIINVYDVNQDGDYLFMSMELLQGSNLRQKMRQQQRQSQPMDEEQVHKLAIALSDALRYAHRRIIHRDIKPENIWLCDDGEVKLMDFGIARTFDQSLAIKTRTIAGSVRYMAPEQLGNGDGGMLEIDHRADQYALGVVLYELLTNQALSGRVKPLHEQRPDLHRPLVNVIETMLEGHAKDRFATTQELYEALQKAFENRRGLSRFAPKLSSLFSRKSK